MADTSESIEDETPNQKQARLRREKRQKKMAEQGEDRLARIKALNGGVAPPEEILGGPAAQTPAATQTPQAAYVEDPDEADISSIKQEVNTRDDPLRAALLQMQQDEALNARAKNAQDSAEDDPMVRMMEQMMSMMGGANTDPADPNAKPPDLPPALKALLGAGQIGTASAEDQTPPATSSEYLWRIVHFVFAFSLATYIALSSTFNGTELARVQTLRAADGEDGYGYTFGRRLFLMFCTAELMLQSSRYFVEKGQLQGSGMLAKVANSGLVPEPWAGYVRIVGRYMGIAQTIFSDAMVVVFVFGVLAWWHGRAAAGRTDHDAMNLT